MELALENAYWFYDNIYGNGLDCAYLYTYVRTLYPVVVRWFKRELKKKGKLRRFWSRARHGSLYLYKMYL